MKNVVPMCDLAEKVKNVRYSRTNGLEITAFHKLMNLSGGTVVDNLSGKGHDYCGDLNNLPHTYILV